MELRDTAIAAADIIAGRLASPDAARRLDLVQGWWPQSLAHGAAGVALLHIERARSGHGPWQRAHDWLACAAEGGAVGGPDTHLYYGAPALAFALHAAADRPGRYARALDTLDTHVTELIRQRLRVAHARIDNGDYPELAEYDAIRGLSGLGALLLRRREHTELLREVLTYLVRLTEPVKHDGELLPGWWTHLAPSGKPSRDYPEGHANNGVAHGIGGPSCAHRPPNGVLGHLGREVAKLLKEGIDPEHIRAGLARHRVKGLHPSTLPSLVHEAMNATGPTGGLVRPESANTVPGHRAWANPADPATAYAEEL